jgi:phasin family protein
MFAQPFSSQPVTPAVRRQLEAQFSLFSDVTQKLFNTAQKINELNIQVAQAVVEESLTGTHQVLSAKDSYEAMAIAAGQAQPVAEKVRAYQQHLSNIAAGTQVELSKTAEAHIPETTRAASAVAEEVARTVNEDTDRAHERQKAAIEKLKNPLPRSDEGREGRYESAGQGQGAQGAQTQAGSRKQPVNA